MIQKQADCIIIGAGVVGLAIGHELSKSVPHVVILEKNGDFGLEMSSRNSEVVHAGIYYRENMLKTQLCIQGNPLLYEFCEAWNIPYRNCGKLIVSNSPEEELTVEAKYRQGVSNGVPGLKMITGKEIRTLEEHVSGVMGVYSETSGIVDSRKLMECLLEQAVGHRVDLFCNSEVCSVEKSRSGYILGIKKPDGEQIEFRTPVVINSAGLGADSIAAMAGFNIDENHFRQYRCKGEYFSISSRHQGKLTHLVYPAPGPNHLGIHAVLCLDGNLKVGPGSSYINEIDYSVNPAHADHFFEKTVHFLPFLEPEDLTPDFSGIRTKLNKPDEPIGDFIIREESARGFPGFINLVGMESPALTACFSIARRTADLL